MESKKKELKKDQPPVKKLECGIIMPISSIDECTSEHWKEVLSIIKESVVAAGFEPNVVSDADDVGIIQRRIIQNVYNNPIVVCDVSGKNPNVMFELGMRLAFDKPTIIIKDDKTSYSFDTSPIEHLEYPRDLRFYKIIDFKETLKDKIKGTYDKSVKDKNYSTFLKHFGEFKIAQIPEKEVSSENYLLQSIDELRAEMRQFFRISRRPISEQSMLFDDSDFSIKQATELVLSYIEMYMKERNITDIKTLKLEDPDLFKYLEGVSVIRKACRTPENLKRIVSNQIGK